MKSAHDLLPHLNTLQHLFTDRVRDDHDAYRTTFYDLERLPHALGAAGYAVSELARLQQKFADEVPDQAFQEADVIGLSSEARDAMTFTVDAFFDACRRAQDGLIPYLTRSFRESLPKSFSRLAKGMEAGKYTLPDRLGANLLKYWENHGRQLKDYRDMIQHHAQVTSDARLFLRSGQRYMHFALASNPEVASAAKLRFENPPVHAYSYLLDEYFALAIFAHWVTLGLVPAGYTARMAVRVFRDALSINVSGTEVPTSASFQTQLDRLQETLEEQARQVR